MTDNGDDDRRAARPLVSVLVVISGGLGISLQQLSTGTPESTGRWVMLIAGAFIGGAASILATGLFERLLTWFGFGWTFLWTRTRLRTVVAGVVACVLAVAAGLVIPVLYEALHRRLYGCPQPAAVRVMTSAEQLGAALRLADAYETATAEHHHGCPTADLYVYGAGPTEARAAVASGWLNDALQRIGPRADVWLPDSTLDVTAAVAASARFGVTVPVAEQRGVGSSPVVLATPPDLSSALDGDLSWRQLWAETGRLGLDVVRPDPAVSTVAGQSRRPAAARALIEFLTGERSQQLLFERGGFAATREIVYRDAAVVKLYRYAPTLLDAIRSAHSRPVTAHYAQFSETFRQVVRAALADGGRLPADAKPRLQRALQGYK
ncbi:hypothetical protein AB0J72_29385 [Dactylosporangium sp. NPDC049742]|uniref:hypothetical protein n=1 Tax=Dactylosporangium sp. NPDC049742 TaxID=3154737 RepID=UPI00344AF9C4